MAYQAGLSQFAALLADPAREAMLATLISGKAYSAGELARVAAVSPQSASAHLRRLLEGGLLHVATEGRKRRYRIAGARVAATIEQLAGLAGELAAERARHAPPALRHGRQCYDHLAGALGVALAEALEVRGFLQHVQETVIVTDTGKSWFEHAFPDCQIDQGGGLLRLCLDWTEGKPHLAGPLARQMLGGMMANGQVTRHGRERIISLTASGQAWFADLDANVPARVRS